MDASALNEMLDGFEYSLRGMKSEETQTIRGIIENLRNENRNRVSENVNVITAKLMANIELLVSGMGIHKKTFMDLQKSIPKLDLEENKLENHIFINGKAVSIQIVQSSINMLKLALDDTKSKDEGESEKIIDATINSYIAYNYQEQEFDMKIVEAQYDLIKKYLLSGKIDEAIKYAQKFDTDYKHFSIDMKQFVFQKMQEKMSEIANNQLRREDNLPTKTKIFLADYLSGIKEIEPANIGLWKTMVELETNAPYELITPEIESRYEKVSEDTNIPVEDDYEIIIIRHDEKGPGGINLKDFERLEKRMHNKKILGNADAYFAKQKKIKIIFEDGITKIPDMKEEKNYADMNTQLVEEVKLPESLVSIGKGVFGGFSSLKRINIPSSVENIGESAFALTGIEKLDLSQTKIKEIKKGTFYKAKIKDIKMPEKLEKVGEQAFAYTSELEKVDFLNTKLIELSDGAFYMSNVRRVRASNELLFIRENCFKNSMLEYFDGIYATHRVLCEKHAFYCENYRAQRFYCVGYVQKYIFDEYVNLTFGNRNGGRKWKDSDSFGDADWDSFDWRYSDDIIKENMQSPNNPKQNRESGELEEI